MTTLVFHNMLRTNFYSMMLLRLDWEKRNTDEGLGASGITVARYGFATNAKEAFSCPVLRKKPCRRFGSALLLSWKRS